MTPEDQTSDSDYSAEYVQVDSGRGDAPAAPLRARLAEVLTGWFFGRNAPATNEEQWLQKRFKYWARQLRDHFADPEGELLSQLALRSDTLDLALDQGYAERILRSAFLDIRRRERGRGAARDATVCTDKITHVSPRVAPNQFEHLELLRRLEDLERLTPRGAEALELKSIGLSDEDACRRSRWPCSPAAFRQRVHAAREQLLKQTENE